MLCSDDMQLIINILYVKARWQNYAAEGSMRIIKKMGSGTAQGDLFCSKGFIYTILDML